MGKTPKDDQATEFQRRPGAVPFGSQGWRLVNTEDDPGSLDPNELQWAQNVRLRGRNIRTRHGHTEIVDLGLGPGGVDSHVMALAHAPVDNPRVRLWLSSKGCFGAAVGTGSTIFRVDPTEVPVVQAYARFTTDSDFQAVLAQFGDKLFLGDRSYLREIIPVTGHPGQSSGSLLFSPSQTPTEIFPGYTIRCMREFDGKLFIGLENTTVPTSSKIVYWDGNQTVDNDLTGVRPPVNFGIWQNRLVAGFDATAAYIRVRPTGAFPTAWVSYALAGYRTSTQSNCMQEVRDKLYIASGTDLIHRFDGNALALVNTIAGAAVDGNGVTSLTLHDGLLHYGWNTPSGAPGYSSSIGRHDPDSTAANEWVDTYKSVTGDAANFIQLSSMLSYRGQIYMGGRQVWVVATAPNDVKGTIQVINDTGAPGAGFECTQCVRFP